MTTHEIHIDTTDTGIIAYCRWNNRRCYAHYDTTTKDFSFAIKGYFKEGGNFALVRHNRGINEVSYRLCPETLNIFMACQDALYKYLRENDKW